MYRLSQLIFLLGWLQIFAQSPHGNNFTIDCIECHNTENWKINRNELEFNHSKTGFELTGVHTFINCKECHSDLIFEKTNSECIDCHIDIHKMTLGSDCLRCHDSKNWLVDDILTIHQENGFQLLGAHFSLQCIDCHGNITELEFKRIGNECINCHFQDFESAQPDHLELGYSKNCSECHSIDGFSWKAEDINHDFFPLEMAHSGLLCSNCHSIDNFKGLVQDCFSCHENDYKAALNPIHIPPSFPIDCRVCHTLNPEWMPAFFESHDSEYFPIYSGNHKNEWNECIDCHLIQENFSIFSCIDCHEHNNKNEMDNEHRGVNGYIFESNACFACHPKGEED